MPDTLHFELVSPERKLLSEPVIKAVFPTEDGEIGVLPNHVSLVTTLKSGVVQIYRSANDDGSAAKPYQIFVAGGFADIGAGHCTLLAELAVPFAELQKESVESDLADLRAALERNPQDKLVQKQVAIKDAQLYALNQAESVA